MAWRSHTRWNRSVRLWLLQGAFLSYTGSPLCFTDHRWYLRLLISISLVQFLVEYLFLQVWAVESCSSASMLSERAVHSLTSSGCVDIRVWKTKNQWVGPVQCLTSKALFAGKVPSNGTVLQHVLDVLHIATNDYDWNACSNNSCSRQHGDQVLRVHRSYADSSTFLLTLTDDSKPLNEYLKPPIRSDSWSEVWPRTPIFNLITSSDKSHGSFGIQDVPAVVWHPWYVLGTTYIP